MKLYLVLVCCILAAASDTYIRDGDIVGEAGKWPWQGSVRGYGPHFCGISLISRKWGVTAAHCIDRELDSYSFLFGSNNRTASTLVVKAATITKHPLYGTDSAFHYDIAVVKFDTEVIGDHIQPVPLAPTGSEHSGNKDCWITGWGVQDGGRSPIELREAHINVYTQEYCRTKVRPMVYDGVVCVGNEVTRGRPSSGDSGGPLVCRVGGRYELVGACSWSTRPDLPDGYTRIAYFREWITEQTGL